ncbi:hypothetical protein AURANDRAFT_70586 [Aureococcus anophagefferens]|uniref:CBS domain-containing protein n=1 Tax=Aureococcus anophagefferens TaxID=44056 RepID=F0XWC1_AURAN|nr:hypothetical protein AURANDRAFT_70586 [Aureococcus anophagefferens]EGB12990.1 hypothetical protein AURANDRAFT_70586 [Aureococcus anophagefferens]|eukprot:XP_009032602.1 hypothetical protein AURANDRAFT_70586 [Aureococcus anophagefferens]
MLEQAPAMRRVRHERKRHSISKADAEALALRLQGIMPSPDGEAEIDLTRSSFHRARNSLIKVAKDAGQMQRWRSGGGGQHIDATWVFSVLALLCDSDVKQCLGFLFELYASRGGKQSQRAVAEMLISVSGACGATLGTKMPDINALEGKARDAIDALAKLIPKDMQSTASKKEPSASMYLTFAQFWDLCQDDVDIAKYIDGVLALRKNETRIGHREQRLDLAAMHTLDAALMDENEDEAESENSSDAELPEGAKVAELAERHEAEGGDDRDAPAERKEKEGERPSGILARHRPPLFMGTIDDYLENDPVDVKSPVLADGTVYVALFTLLERSQLAMPLIRRGALVGVVSAAHALDQVVSRLLDAMEEAGDVRVDAACAATKKRFWEDCPPPKGAPPPKIINPLQALEARAKSREASGEEKEKKGKKGKKKGAKEKMTREEKRRSAKGNIMRSKSSYGKEAMVDKDDDADAPETAECLAGQEKSANFPRCLAAVAFLEAHLPAALAENCVPMMFSERRGHGGELVPHPLILDCMPFHVLESIAQGHIMVPVVQSIACKKEDVVTILTPRDVFNMLHLEPRLLGEVWHTPIMRAGLVRMPRTVSNEDPLWRALVLFAVERVPAVAVVDDDGLFCGALTPDVLRLVMDLKHVNDRAEPEPPKPRAPAAPGAKAGGLGGGLAAARRDSGGWGAMKAGMKLMAIAKSGPEEKSPNAECTPVVEKKMATTLAALFCEPVKQVLRYLYEEPWCAVGHNHTIGGCVVNAALTDYGHLDRVHVLNNRRLVGVLLIHDIARLILDTQLKHDPAANRLPPKRRASSLAQTGVLGEPAPETDDAAKPR